MVRRIDRFNMTIAVDWDVKPMSLGKSVCRVRTGLKST